jgi:hypothetical protein
VEVVFLQYLFELSLYLVGAGAERFKCPLRLVYDSIF